MKNIKKGDIIQWYYYDGEQAIKEEVRARIEDLVFTRKILKEGVGPTTGPYEIEDLISWGYKKSKKTL